jgi:hypothetical protein
MGTTPASLATSDNVAGLAALRRKLAVGFDLGPALKLFFFIKPGLCRGDMLSLTHPELPWQDAVDSDWICGSLVQGRRPYFFVVAWR